MSDIPSGALDAGDSKAVSLLARVILPRPGEPLDVRKLYIEESDTNARRAHAPTRTTLEIGAESEVSFATYFNAFPASYWRRWSKLESVVLRVELTGTARVDVYRSKATGARITVSGAPVSSGDSDEPAVVEFEIGLDPFEDGGFAERASTLISGAENRSVPLSFFAGTSCIVVLPVRLVETTRTASSSGLRGDGLFALVWLIGPETIDVPRATRRVRRSKMADISG
jgi:hypothetical protein